MPSWPATPGIGGTKPLRSLLEADRPPARTRSEAEQRLLALIRRARLPNPEVNASLGRWEIDFLWREQSVAVEVDGYASHSSPSAFRRDHAKTAELQAIGIYVIRLSWQQIVDEAAATVALLAAALVRFAAPRGRGEAP